MTILLRLARALPAADRDSILLLCKELGYETRSPLERPDLLELANGTPTPDHLSRLSDLTGVLAVLDRGEARQLGDRAPSAPDRQVAIGAALFGKGAVSIIAGPCAVESYPRLVEIASAVRDSGAVLLRGGAFKPRTSPYSFQGLGRAGLEILARVKAETGIGVVTEVLDPRDVEAVGEIADAFQIGARSMSNFALLREVGAARTPVLLKRGFGATVKEFMEAAEYVLAGGNDHVVLCERGVRGFDSVTRNLLDVGAVAHLKAATDLPIIVDPSHAAGRADLVPALARAGIVAGADGLLIEVHPNPGEVHSDGAQALSLPAFQEVVHQTAALVSLDGRRLITPSTTPSSNGTPGAHACLGEALDHQGSCVPPASPATGR